ncbi:MAG: prolyl oligopeptidase family serine peptidase [Chloroflexia bacterium]|nr:prolyl oligopeptidase family serine peptidase [Chloroflexia bacterium]
MAVADVPFVDVLNEMQDTLWPNIIGHFYEIGNPFNKVEYDSIKAYCPYQNSTSKAYPNLLVTSGYMIQECLIWSPAKWVAKLRENKNDSTELLFRTNMDAGHGGASGRYAGYKEEAFTMAFIMKSLGIKENYIELKGKIVDKDGSPVQFANVYLKGTTHGTSSNYDGEFLLELREGQPHEIVFQAIGFSTKVINIDMNVNTSDLKVVMENEDQYISQVIVTSDGKDPAYGIIKNAQKKRKYYLNQVKSYTADIYMKGAARLNEIPKKIPKFLKDQAPDSSDIGLVYLSESVARYHYKAPSDYKEEMFASKSAGIQRGYSWNRASDVLMSFYKNTVDFPWYSEREFISPISSSSNFYYKYKLVESYKEQDRLVHKIQVIPRRKSDPVFKGFIYINDGIWNINSLNLTIGKESQIEFVDSVNIKQSHVPISDSIYMPLSMEITDHIKIFKFGVTSKNVGFFSNYNINRKFSDDFFKREVFRVEKGANKKDSVFWEDTRPALLTLEEEKKYHKSDSMLIVRESKVYQDSVNHARNKVTFGKVALWDTITEIILKTKTGVSIAFFLWLILIQ